VNSQANRIYATYSGSNSLLVIDGDTNAVVTTIPLGGQRDDVAVNPATDRIYAICDNNVAVIDGATNAIMDTVSGLGAMDDLAVNPWTNRIYINGISEIHVMTGATNNLVATVSDLPSIWDLAVNPHTGRVYVTHSMDNIVSVIQDVAGPPPTYSVCLPIIMKKAAP